MENEIWKDVKGYEGIYQVSNFGRVRSLDRWIERNGKPAFIKGKMLKFHKRSGYNYVQFRVNGDGKNHHHAVHRLVGIAFVPGYSEKYDINHKDNNRTNNHADNLEWCTRSYNIQYMHDHFPREEPSKRAVIQIDKNGNDVARFESMNEAAEAIGVSLGLIWVVCNHYGRHKTAGGYRWRYADE